ncbi:MAG TPA: ATP-binding cassette domain-containing protein [Tenuifilaceae bacterium]|nr:ATP-binding cassette domain-containing protein [Tenuifilaceae bacterium]HPJ46986.1 ATP-binding cassette domain-containing protein [Tenuifilaceae bacterium]HPQ35481.1 ATP-binding cassette domain-containing protein [Tenuifilaceae bacterium]HRX69528.1 ATP-binding cassette domain-containing protein [Tenuifilaceae bacterium]
MEILTTHGIEKQFANHKALDDVSISVPEGSIYGLLGPNGAGKTTLIRIINQITGPDKGEVTYKGRPMKADDIYSIGYLPEERGLYKKMKVGEHALYLARLKGLSRSEALKRLKFWFEKMEIQGWWDKKIEELSKGMAQKIQFVVTVIHEPKLLIFDEPFSGFDPINANLIKNEILELKKNGATILFSTHNMGSVEEMCDHITLINKSKNILSGPIEKIRQDYGSNVFQFKLKGDIEKVKENLTPSYELISHTQDTDIVSAQIKVHEYSNDNKLLSLIIPSAEILGFSQVVPSMNDIFIQVVQEYNKAHGLK